MIGRERGVRAALPHGGKLTSAADGTWESLLRPNKPVRQRRRGKSPQNLSGPWDHVTEALWSGRRTGVTEGECYSISADSGASG